MTEYPPTSPVYAWPLLEGDQPNDWRHVDAALLAVEATVEAVEALAAAADVSVTGDAGVGVTEPTPDGFVLATRVSADAGNALELRPDGLYSTDTTGGAAPVVSVNGETGAVVLDAADVGALPLSARAHDHTDADGSGVLSNDEHDGYSQYTNLGADPGTPATNRIRLYAKDNGSGVATLYYISESGQIYEIPTLTTGGGGSGAPATASYITTAAETKLHQETVLGAGVIMSGTLASRPAFGTAGRLYLATDTDLVYRDTGSAWAAFADRAGWTSFVIDGGGSAITTGVKGHFVVPGGTLVETRLLADVSGSVVLDLWKDTYTNYPPTVGDSICASAKPTLSSAVKATDTTLTGWTTALTEGDILAVNVDSATTVTRVTLGLRIRRA